MHFSPNICTFWDTDQFVQEYPKYSTPPQIWMFYLKCTKIQTSLFPPSHIIFNPNWTKKSHKLPSWSSSWTWNRCTQTLPGGDLFRSPCFGHWKIELPSQRNLLKSPGLRIVLDELMLVERQLLILHSSGSRDKTYLWYDNLPRIRLEVQRVFSSCVRIQTFWKCDMYFICYSSGQRNF